MEGKKYFISSLIAHILIISLIILSPSCPKKEKKIQVVENVKIITEKEKPKQPKKQSKKQTPKKQKTKKETKPKKKKKPKTPKKKAPKKIIKRKKILPKLSPEELKKRLKEKLKNTPEKEEKKTETQNRKKQSTKIRSTIKENWYLSIIKSKIENSWKQPSKILLTGRNNIKITIGFVLLKNGECKNIRIKKTSGIPIVDMSAINAVKDAAPFPPTPNSVEEDEIEIAIDFILKQ